MKATEDPTLAAAIGYLLSSRGRTTSPTRMAAGYDRGLSWRMGYPSGVPPRASVNQLVFERFQERPGADDFFALVVLETRRCPSRFPRRGCSACRSNLE